MNWKLTRPEPIQVIHLLPWYSDVHAPHPADDIHGQYDGTQHGEFSEHIGCLFLSLVHAYVDLREIVRVGAGK